MTILVHKMGARTKGNWERLQRLRRWPPSSSLEPMILKQGEVKVVWERCGLLRRGSPMCSGRQVNEADTFQQLPREELQHSWPREWRVGANKPRLEPTRGEFGIQTKKLKISIANSGF